MLILRNIINRRSPSITNAYYCYIRYLSTKTKLKEDSLTSFTFKLPSAKPKKEKRAPFVKNLFIGKFDHEFLAFPEPQAEDRYNEFNEWLEAVKSYINTINPKEFENKCAIPRHVLQRLGELGVFGSRIPTDYNGLNLLNSEFMQLLEAVGKIPALGLFFLEQGVKPVELFNSYGTIEQKLKYLSKIALGKSVASVAVTEKESGPSARNFQSVGVLSHCDKYWTIDAEKDIVANTNIADIYLVYAFGMHPGEVQRRPENLTCFIVDANTEGVSVIPNSFETMGCKGFSSGKIILKNVVVPKENILGKIGDGTEQLADFFSSKNHYIAGLTIALLKNYLQLLTEDTLYRKHFDQPLRDTESTQKIFANIACSIYCMESVLYLTTGIMDEYNDQDMQLETALVEQYCVQECIKSIQESMWLVGPRICTLVQPFEQVLRDAITITNYETSLFDRKILTGLLGLQYFGIQHSEEIKMDRNPFMFPFHAMSKIFKSTKTLKLHLEDYLHPSLKECADFCDQALFDLKHSTKILLLRDGAHATLRQPDLIRIADMVSLIYVYIANISRASRSYCIGNRDSEAEIRLCMIQAYRLKQNVSQLAHEVLSSEYGNGDYLCRDFAKIHFEKKEYFLQNALKRNY